MNRHRRTAAGLSVHPELHYLDFDFSDEESGRGSFDAMASVMPVRLPALLAEIGAVLGWATDAFGPCGASEDEGEWGCELQGISEPAMPLKVVYEGGVVNLEPAVGVARTTFKESLVILQYFEDMYPQRPVAQQDPWRRAVENMLTRMEGAGSGRRGTLLRSCPPPPGGGSSLNSLRRAPRRPDPSTIEACVLSHAATLA